MSSTRSDDDASSDFVRVVGLTPTVSGPRHRFDVAVKVARWVLPGLVVSALLVLTQIPFGATDGARGAASTSAGSLWSWVVTPVPTGTYVSEYLTDGQRMLIERQAAPSGPAGCPTAPPATGDVRGEGSVPTGSAGGPACGAQEGSTPAGTDDGRLESQDDVDEPDHDTPGGTQDDSADDVSGGHGEGDGTDDLTDDAAEDDGEDDGPADEGPEPDDLDDPDSDGSGGSDNSGSDNSGSDNSGSGSGGDGSDADESDSSGSG